MSNTPHILLVEDDAEIAQLVTTALQRAGFHVTHLASGRTVTEMIAADRPDLILLDLLLPGEDGISIARRIRMTHTIPIIMLTAMGEERDRINGLELGADDYVTKPFSARELVARIRAVLRRSLPQPADRSGTVQRYGFAGWALNARRRELYDPSGVRVEVTSAEFELLRTFCEHPGTVLGRDQLARLAQGRRVEPYDRSIDTMVSRLRTKIEPEETSPSLIKTVRHSGYVFTPQVEVTEE